MVAGDLTGLRGRVERIDEEGMVHVRPQGLDGVKEAIEIEPRDIVKFFNVRSGTLLLTFDVTGALVGVFTCSQLTVSS